MKRRAIVFCALFFSTLPALPQEPVIAVSDFQVESDDAGYKYLGKGISRLVASELRKSGRVKLVEREQLNRVLSEQELSLSDLMDETTQLKIGKMISAAYIVMGDIIDMGKGGVLVSVRMVRAETGEIVWQDENQETLTVYDYLGAFFAQSLLDSLGVKASPATIAKIEKKEEKRPEAIIKTSQGIDAYDRNDTETAKKTLEEARAIDPANDVAAEYLAKLTSNTTKFKIALEPYYPDQNPAYLGIIRTDRMYFSESIPPRAYLFDFAGSVPSMILPNGNLLRELSYRVKLGYAFPCAGNLGFGIEAIYFGSFTSISHPEPFPSILGMSNQAGAGGTAIAGMRIGDSVSLGISASVFAESNLTSIFFSADDETLHPACAFSGGVLYRNADESVLYDAQIGYCAGRAEHLDPDTGADLGYAAHPLFVENTLTLSFNQKRTFLIVKQANDIGIDRVYYYGRIIPAFEHFILDWLSLRLSGELAYARLDESNNFGYGIIGGLTFRIADWGTDIDVTVTYRVRPMPFFREVMFPESIGLINVGVSGLFASR